MKTAAKKLALTFSLVVACSAVVAQADRTSDQFKSNLSLITGGPYEVSGTVAQICQEAARIQSNNPGRYFYTSLGGYVTEGEAGPSKEWEGNILCRMSFVGKQNPQEKGEESGYTRKGLVRCVTGKLVNGSDYCIIKE
ncbi:hypothetical protein CUZ56_01952 [Saezia sanguinis]|uniref:Uncharacterized protein n=1 Tax=Saezia sanguinis TaxID=1965230 RepID=A0A433SD60_9BURK|nr:hypothetical protein [Saezia sanguinis]RUS66671.1 hypothetical protein CUZ56_01952 [Saezia sanguinis]